MSQLPDSVTEPRLGLLAVFVPGGPKRAGQLAGDSLSGLQKGPWNLGIDEQWRAGQEHLGVSPELAPGLLAVIVRFRARRGRLVPAWLEQG